MLECYREWEAICEKDPTTVAYEDWVPLFVQNFELDTTKPKDVDQLLLSTKPSQKAACYTKMKSFGNHRRVDDGDAGRTQTWVKARYDEYTLVDF